MQREEIKEAIENGEATVSRYSDTQKGKVYYYAKQLDNGNVLRVSSKATNIGEFFSDYIVYILICLIAVIIAAVFVSVAITKSIVKPITQLGKNLDNIDEFKADEEFKPLINALLEQKKRQKVLDRQKSSLQRMCRMSLKHRLHQLQAMLNLLKPVWQNRRI